MLQKVGYRLYSWCFLSIVILASCETSPVKNEPSKHLFDGVSFSNWEGDTSYWKIRDSVIWGEVTPEHPLEHNTFLIYTGTLPSDFELTMEYKISDQGNSGVQYRSQEVPGLKYALKGYQADIDGANTYTGQNYEERGRGFLAKRGESAELKSGLPPQILDSLGTREELRNAINTTDWNELVIRAEGFRLEHFINGKKMSSVLDRDTINRSVTGLLGLQLHVAPQMWVQYKNIRLKQL
ncbi:MAG: DUF1080 domain-containing protein [Flavipsychrobacter sp.]|jgi:hypothetical protein|nr:DUF1080 domain-containing protein [Flavipsychrobacter sp.]